MKAPTARELLESYLELQAGAAALAPALAQAKMAAQQAPTAHNRRRLGLLQTEARRRQRHLRARHQLLENLLAALPADERRVLALRYLSGLAYADISETLGFCQRHVYRLHLQGVRSLQACL